MLSKIRTLHVWKLVLFFLILISVAAFIYYFFNPSVIWKSYTDPGKAFTFEYPSSWKITKEENSKLLFKNSLGKQIMSVSTNIPLAVVGINVCSVSPNNSSCEKFYKKGADGKDKYVTTLIWSQDKSSVSATFSVTPSRGVGFSLDSVTTDNLKLFKDVLTSFKLLQK